MRLLGRGMRPGARAMARIRRGYRMIVVGATTGKVMSVVDIKSMEMLGCRVLIISPMVGVLEKV